MRVTATGWSRNAGQTVILDQEIRDETNPLSYERKYKPHVLSIEYKAHEVRMDIGPTVLTMNGRYSLSIRFTNEDIARLFLLAHPEFSATVEAIYSKPAPVPLPNKPGQPTAATAAQDEDGPNRHLTLIQSTDVGFR
jgi:hypothetical protein